MPRTNKYHDPVTGEVRNEKHFEKGDVNFHKVWIFNLEEYLKNSNSSLGKTILFKLFSEMDKHNKINSTLKQLSCKFQITELSIKCAFAEFKQYDLLRNVRNGVYMLNPDVAFAGSGENRLIALKIYDSLNIPRELEKEINKRKKILDNLQKLDKMSEDEKKELAETLFNSPSAKRIIAELMFKQDL